MFAYDVAVAGKLVKCVFAAGCNVSSGKEPKGGVTTVAFKKDELPSGETLTFSVTPRSCLGTAGTPIETSLQYQYLIPRLRMSANVRQQVRRLAASVSRRGVLQLPINVQQPKKGRKP